MKLFGYELAKAQPVETKAEEISLSELWARMANQWVVHSRQSVTPETAMQCTTIQGIVRALTNAIGSYPVSVGESVDGDSGTYFKRNPNHGLTRLLRKPNAVQTSTEFWRMVMKHSALHGNFYALKGQGQTGPIAFLRPIEKPDMVSVDDINWKDGVMYRVNFDDGQRFIPQSQMFHVTSGIVSDDGVTGESPVRLAREAIGLCIAAEKFVAELYGNNAVPSILLTGGKFASAEQYEIWVQKWREAYGGGNGQRGGTAMLPEGMDAKEMAFKPIDAQVLEMRKFQRVEIAQVYGVPPHKLADLERATFSNIEEQSLEFVRDVAKPWVRLIEQAATRDLIAEPGQRRGEVVRFDMEAATEGKLKERLEAYGKAYEIGAMNPNEIRQRIGLDPRDDEGGDAFATALNMRTTDDVSGDTEGEGDPDDDSEGSDDPSAIRAVQ